MPLIWAASLRLLSNNMQLGPWSSSRKAGHVNKRSKRLRQTCALVGMFFQVQSPSKTGSAPQMIADFEDDFAVKTSPHPLVQILYLPPPIFVWHLKCTDSLSNHSPSYANNFQFQRVSCYSFSQIFWSHALQLDTIDLMRKPTWLQEVWSTICSPENNTCRAIDLTKLVLN